MQKYFKRKRVNIKIIFDKMTSIIKNANEEMKRFVQNDVEQYFDENNYTVNLASNVETINRR